MIVALRITPENGSRGSTNVARPAEQRFRSTLPGRCHYTRRAFRFVINGENPTMKVGFIGLGMMGGGMALNLRKAGHDVLVYDVRPDCGKALVEAGATWAETVADVGRAADV